MGKYGEPEDIGDNYTETKITPNADGEGVKVEQTIIENGQDVTPDK